jgi:hypothetical protein
LAIELSIINRRFGGCIQIDPDDVRSQHCGEVVGDEAIAAANIENARIGGNYARDLQGHVIGAPDLAAPPLATPPPLNAVQ